jgi:hypothetical protein
MLMRVVSASVILCKIQIISLGAEERCHSCNIGRMTGNGHISKKPTDGSARHCAYGRG